MSTAATPWIWHLDRPTYRPAGEIFEVVGWVAGDATCELATVRDRLDAFAWLERKDLVPPPAGHRWASGFRFRVGASALEDGVLSCWASGASGVTKLDWRFRESIETGRKARKLARIRRELLLPGAEPRATGDFLNFLPGAGPLAEPELTSGYGYPANVEALVARHADGWILDCGAGHRPMYLDNVVNLEIAPYPSTDVLADAERLPFRDGCFDGIVTLAVLEHVRRPWVVARELVRVLKPGGTIIADVPLLQPVHAYPSHFFNMTSEGLQSLFAESCEIVETAVPHYGRPAYTLAWFLQRYVAGLPADVRERFLELRVADLVKPIEQQLASDYVGALPKEFQFELASVTTVVAQKR